MLQNTVKGKPQTLCSRKTLLALSLRTGKKGPFLPSVQGGEDEHATITILLSHKKIYLRKYCVVVSMTVIGGTIPETRFSGWTESKASLEHIPVCSLSISLLTSPCRP